MHLLLVAPQCCETIIENNKRFKKTTEGHRGLLTETVNPLTLTVAIWVQL